MANEFTEFTEVAHNPAAQAAISRLLEDEPDSTPAPSIRPPAEGIVRLPGGVVVGEQKITEIEVQELTGEAEERLSKAKAGGDLMRFYNTLLQEGTADIGGKDAADLIPQMLVGDRECLLLGIREATYGPEIDLGQVYCPECRDSFDGVVSVHDIPIRELSGETTFEVKLRKGGKARVRLPIGADQTAYLKDSDITDSERNSILLSRCVITVPQNGEDMPVAGFPSLVLGLGIVDRRNILAEIDKRQPGPRYDEVEIEHECGTKVTALVGMGALFPGL